jgi:peptidoglycan/LPS O-acetylase OafA/YrhL
LRVGARSPAARQLAALAALGAASVAVRAVLAGSILGPVGKGGYVEVTALPGCLDWFALGMGLAILKAQVEPEVARMHFAVRLAERPAMCAAAACGLFVVAAVLEPRDLFVTVYGPLVHVLMGVAAALLVLPLALGNGLRHSRLRAWITSPRMIWLGTISYGIYLWHMIVLDLIGGGELTPPVTPAPLAHAAGLLVLVAAGAIACGALSWYLIERPAGRLVARRSALLAARATA